MPQPLFLHIRPRGRGETRVLGLSCDSIRVGRGVVCEVRIDDPSLAEVECFLRRRGETWHVQPLSPKGRISIDGRPVLHLRALAMNVPLRLGDATLVLRDTASISPAFGAIEVPAASDPSAALCGSELRDDDRLGDRPYEPSRMVPLRRAAISPVPQDSLLNAPQVPRARPGSRERSWELRWRAVGRSLKLRTQVANIPRYETPLRSSEPATVPFTPRPAQSRVATEDPVVKQARPCSQDGSAAEVCWAIPIASPDAILRASTEFGAFDEPTRTATTTVDPPSSSSPVAESPRSPLAPKENDAQRKRDQALAERPIHPFDEEWPSVRSILQSHQLPHNDLPRSRTAATSRPVPTEATIPACWSPPSWLFALPMVGAILVLGAIGIFLGATWGEDDRQAGLLADRLLQTSGGANSPIAEDEVNLDGSWWRTTGNHLAIRAAALGSTRGEASREEAARFLLDSARVAAPLEPATRVARAELSASDRGGASPQTALGLSRDTVSLALTARTLAREGKTEAALQAYRSALNLAARADIGRARTSTLLEEPNAKRFSLPFEGLIAGVIRDMAAQPGWTYETWSTALPEHGLVLLAAYRVLSERGASESEAVLNRLVECPAALPVGSQALHSVAMAEGLAIKGRWQEAASLYANAIAAMPEEAVRRTWHLNRAVILARNGEVDQATDAMASARAGRGDDEIGRKVSQAMSREGMSRTPATTSRTSPGQTLRTN